MFATSVLFWYLDDLDSDPVAMERNMKRLKEEQSKSKNPDLQVLKHLLVVTFETRYNKKWRMAKPVLHRL